MSNSEDLLKWVTPEHPEQLAWISNYLKKRWDAPWLHSGNFVAVKSELMRMLETADGREIIRKMRAAWYQRQYRTKLGKQVSFQIPNTLSDKLSSIAKDRNQSKTQTLRQIINDASTHHKERKSKLLKENKRLKEQLKKLSDEKLMSESVRNKFINSLLQELAHEIEYRLYYQETVGPLSEEEMEQCKDNDQYQAMLKARVAEFETKTSHIQQLLRSGIKPFKNHFKALVK